MKDTKKVKKSGSSKNWPNERELARIREELSSESVEGSTVVGPDAPLVDRVKQNLCSKIVQYQVETHVPQKALAKKLGIDEPEMSRILHYKLERYSIDRLID